MSRLITIITSLPDKSLHPNARSHWAAKSGATKKQRRRTGDEATLARMNLAGKWLPVRSAMIGLHFKFMTNNNQKHDSDNAIAWSKASIDGLVDGGVLLDDNLLTYLPPHQTIVNKASEESLAITVENSTGCRLFILTDQEILEIEAELPDFFSG